MAYINSPLSLYSNTCVHVCTEIILTLLTHVSARAGHWFLKN